MSLFKTILSKIFATHDEPISPAPSPPVTPAPAEAAPDTTRASSTGNSFGAAAGSAFGSASSATATSTIPSSRVVASNPASPSTHVDIAAVMDRLAAGNPETLDWRRSIVDLMKLLDMDSSLTARKELASELHYPGDTNNSAGMNAWLHQQVLRQLVDNGGKVPADLLASQCDPALPLAT